MSPQFWTTLTPRKLYWEATQIPNFTATNRDNFYQNWHHNPTFLQESMHLLRDKGITGLRLNIFNFEITTNGKEYNWQPLETALNAAQHANLQVDLCIGPFAYPLWPGLRLPELLKKHLPPDSSTQLLDHNNALNEFARHHISQQLERYGQDERVEGFYLSNEWPNDQQVEGQERLWSKASQELIKQLAIICQEKTNKTITMNTNLDATQINEISTTYQPIWQLLPKQFNLALDVYPSQENIKKSPLLWIKRQQHSYQHAIYQLAQKIPVPLTFGELEAQPWGNGQSWFTQITAPDLLPQSAGNFNLELIKTYRRYVYQTPIQKITWWGSEYWIIQALLSNLQPLNTIQQLSKIHNHHFNSK